MRAASRPARRSGEISARGPQVMRGYLNAPAATAEAIDADGWFHTGDIGEFDEAGRLRITDRIKNLIVLDNGKKVSPTPMEIALSGSPYIAQAVIIGDGNASSGALVVPDFDSLGAWGRDAGLDVADPATIADQPAVIALIEAEMRRLAAKLTQPDARMNVGERPFVIVGAALVLLPLTAAIGLLRRRSFGSRLG